MKTLIDIHSHILPGVDDGADNMEESMQMLRMAAEDGISQIILTPHNKPGRRNVSYAGIVERIDRLRDGMEQEGLTISLYAGSELYYRSGLSEEIENGNAATMADSHYVLTEFSPSDDYDYIRKGIYSLLAAGYHPILAHVERYHNVCGRKSGVEELANMGCYIQVNAGSVMGNFGFAACQFTRKLLKQRLVSFVATDAHDTDRRTPYLSECAEYVGKKMGESYSQEIFCDNPMRVIKDEYI